VPKLVDVIAQAVIHDDAATLGRCVEQLRYKFNFDYEQAYQFVNKQRPLTRAHFEALMMEADSDESR
jgi:hypothetical protein